MPNKTGRPLKYKTPEELQDAIDRYFKDCEGEPLIGADGAPMINKLGEPVMIRQRPPTMAGLALALGFANRKALLEYQPKPAFSATVTRAKARVEAYAEERLFDRDGQRGSEFSLRHNFGWNEDTKAAPENELLAGIARMLISGQSTSDK